MVCKICGAINDDGINFCSTCGAALVEDNEGTALLNEEPAFAPAQNDNQGYAVPQPEVSAQPQPDPQPEVYAQPMAYTQPQQDTYQPYVDSSAPAEEKSDSAKGLSIAALVLGILGVVTLVGLCCCYGSFIPVIFSVIGLILSVMAKKKQSEKNVITTVAFALSLTALIISALVIIGWIIYVVLFGGLATIGTLGGMSSY